jgi:hypothetical protein
VHPQPEVPLSIDSFCEQPHEQPPSEVFLRENAKNNSPAKAPITIKIAKIV